MNPTCVSMRRARALAANASNFTPGAIVSAHILASLPSTSAVPGPVGVALYELVTTTTTKLRLLPYKNIDHATLYMVI